MRVDINHQRVVINSLTQIMIMKKFFTHIVAAFLIAFFSFGLGMIAAKQAYKEHLVEAIELLDSTANLSAMNIDVDQDPLSQILAKIWTDGSAHGFSSCW